MGITRREFIRGSLFLGGSLVFWPLRAHSKEEPWEPGYLRLEREGLLAGRVEQAAAFFRECRLCPRECGVDRSGGEKGFCRAPASPVVFSAHPHFGEERPLVGEGGSGTIFFSNCNLRCVFCQNWPIAHEGRGSRITEEELAGMMLKLQKIGCHNINLVTPTHVMPNILGALKVAMKKGLKIPLVYNTSGYERREIVELLDGIVDIYLPDFKFFDPEEAARYSAGASDYPEVTGRAIIEMNRQVGGLELDGRGAARRGLIIRHLVMPDRVAGTKGFVQWVARNLPKSTYVNIMAQYRVEYKAFEHPRIARGITVEEFLEAMEWADRAGLTNLDVQSLIIREIYRRR
jgi:putative pyruvate formate lyase activating enzyme